MRDGDEPYHEAVTPERVVLEYRVTFASGKDFFVHVRGANSLNHGLLLAIQQALTLTTCEINKVEFWKVQG